MIRSTEERPLSVSCALANDVHTKIIRNDKDRKLFIQNDYSWTSRFAETQLRTRLTLQQNVHSCKKPTSRISLSRLKEYTFCVANIASRLSITGRWTSRERHKKIMNFP